MNDPAEPGHRVGLGRGGLAALLAALGRRVGLGRGGLAARFAALGRRVGLGRGGLAALLATGFAALLAASVAIRWPGFTQGGFANHDVAGILYNGMLLHAGKLPYVHSYELKPPGTFYLAAWLAGPHATEIGRFQIWANLAALGSMVTLAWMVRRLWGWRSAFVATLLYALTDAHLDSMDANYVTWAQLPMLLAILAALHGLASAPSGALFWFASGILSGCAALCKQPPGAVALGMAVILAAWPVGLRPCERRSWASRVRSIAFVLLGCVSAHVPLALDYAQHDALPALLGGYVFNARGAEYLRFGTSRLGAEAWREGPLALLHALALPLGLASVAAWPPRTPTERSVWGLLLIWCGLAMAAASLGFRFYKGYFLAVSPPLCVLAAAPWGAFGRTRVRSTRVRLLVAGVALPLLLRQAHVLAQERTLRRQSQDEGARRVARYLRPYLQPGDSLWVWGWHLWDVYPLTGHLSSTRYYKSFGIITTDNDATWRRPRSTVHFRDGARARALLTELEAAPPRAIVLGSTVPHAEFSALRRFLRLHYRRDPQFRLGRVQIWHLRDTESRSTSP